MAPFDIESLARSVLRVGGVRVDVGRLCVLGRGEEGRLTPKAIAVLVELARHPRQTVTRAELLDRVWPDSQPTPDALSHAVRELRRALGDDARAPSLIDTVHGLGYRLMLPVAIEPLEVSEPTVEPEAPLVEPPTATPNDVVPAPVPVSAIAAAPVSSPTTAVSNDGADATAGSRAKPRRRALPIAVGAVVLLLATLAAWRPWLRESVPGPAAAPWSARLVTSDPGAEEFPKLSPDGSMLAFTRRASPDGRYDLGVMSIAGSEPIALTHTPDEDELWPVWSSDGAWIAYLHIDGERCGIEIVPATGGAARRAAECDRVVFSGIDWSPDGTHLLTALPSPSPGRELRLYRVPLGEGAPQAIDYRVDRPGWDRDPMYSPDGKHIAFRRGLPPDYDLFVIPAAGGAARRVTYLGSVGEGFAWSSDGREVIFWSQHEGPPALYRVDVASGALRATGLTNASRPHVARHNGRLAFQRPWLRVGMLAADVERPSAAPEPLSASTGSVGFMAASPDNRRLAYVSDRGGYEQVWVHDAAGSADRAYGDETLRRITSLDWSDDGRQLLLVVRRQDADHALMVDLESGKLAALGLARPLLRDAVVGETPDRLYAIVQGEERPMLARFDRDGRRWRETRSEIPATELIRVPGVPGVFGRTPLRADVIVQVDPQLTLREIALRPRIYGWAPGGGAIWYLSSTRRASADLRRLDLVTGEDRLVRSMPHHLPRRRAGMGMLGARAVVAVLVEDAADIGLVDAPR